MKKSVVMGFLLILLLFMGKVYAAPSTLFSEQLVKGSSQGNHKLDCTVIRPWSRSSGPGNDQYPIIVWANGWGGNNNAGESTTAGYKPGLIEWALDGPYIVIAANAWSPRESDVLACLQWIVDQNTNVGGEYEDVVNITKIGLAGHSQGAGAVIKAGDGEPNGLDITAVVAMNPYGPSWIDAGNQDGPVMAIGGTDDNVVPLLYFEDAWIAIVANDQGGLLAVLQGGDHSSDAWGPVGENPEDNNFGRYQDITELWWQYHLNDNAVAGRTLKRILDKSPWDTQYVFTADFYLP
jgi:hypothetical protein